MVKEETRISFKKPELVLTALKDKPALSCHDFFKIKDHFWQGYFES